MPEKVQRILFRITPPLSNHVDVNFFSCPFIQYQV